MSRLKRAVQALVEPHFRTERKVAYGNHPSQILDIYYPRVPSSAPAPVLVFLHGGGFRGGSPAANAYQGRAALERGAMYVAMGYRLIPDARFPDSVEDVERGLQWLRDHLAERGGDPSRMVLAGHSAGAMLAAWVGLRQSSLPLKTIKGLVLISGFYDLAPQSPEIINSASSRYVPDLAQAIERAPAHTVLVVGDQDFPRALPDGQALLAALRARGASVEFFVEEADHYAANRGFITADTPVFRAVQRMLTSTSIADELQAALERIDEELQAIPDERWAHAVTSTEGWPVGHVAHHIAEGYRQSLTWIERALADGKPIELNPAVDIPAINAANAHCLETHGAEPRAETMALLRTNAGQLVDRVRSLTAEQLEAPMMIVMGDTRPGRQVALPMALRHATTHMDSIRAAG